MSGGMTASMLDTLSASEKVRVITVNHMSDRRANKVPDYVRICLLMGITRTVVFFWGTCSGPAHFLPSYRPTYYHCLSQTRASRCPPNPFFNRKTCIQAPTQKIFKILMRWPLEEDFNRISTTSAHQDLHQIMQGHREDFTKTSSRASHKDLHKITQRPLIAFH